MQNEAESGSGSRLMPPAAEVLAAAIQYLVEGDEHEEASVLGQCTLELAAPPVRRGTKQRVDVTLRGSRKVVERLRPPADGEDESALRRRIRLAIQNALPCGLKMVVFGARVGLGNHAIRVLTSGAGEVSVTVGPPAGGNGKGPRLLTAGDGGRGAGGCAAGLAVLGTKLDEGFSRVSHEVRQVGLGVERMGGHVDTVARKQSELRRENAELKAAKAALAKMQGEGLFAFARQIDAEAREQFMAIMASGDVAKAARELGLKDSTLRSKLEKWPKRGKAYAALAELVRWRKAIKGQAGMECAKREASGAERDVDFPALVRDVIEELEALDPENWEERCERLAGALRQAVS